MYSRCQLANNKIPYSLLEQALIFLHRLKLFIKMAVRIITKQHFQKSQGKPLSGNKAFKNPTGSFCLKQYIQLKR